MRPRAFLEPAFRVPYRPQIPGNGTPRFLLFTTKRTRNGQDLRWILCPLRIEFDHLFVQSAKTSPTSSLNLFIYYFLEEEEEEAKKTLAPSANHFWHTHTIQNSIQAHRCFEVGEVRALGLSRHVYTFSTSRERNYQSFEGKIGL